MPKPKNSKKLDTEVSTYYIIYKSSVDCFLYDSGFGNVLFGTQMGYGLKVITSILDSIKKEHSIKVFFMKIDTKSGLTIDKTQSESLSTTPRANFIEPEKPLSSKYKRLLNIKSRYYCISPTSDAYFLYDSNFGSPLLDIVTEGDKKILYYSYKKGDTKKLIDSLVKSSTVFSLKLDEDKGMTEGDKDMESIDPVAVAEESTEDAKK